MKKYSLNMKWMEHARDAAPMSPDPSTKVGACIMDRWEEKGVVSYNDFPDGIPKDWWDDRPLKYKGVVHAEVRAILRMGHASDGATLYVTAHPCRDCAKVIAAAGIACVVCPPGPWRDDPAVIETVKDAAEIFQLCGVEVVHAS